MSRDYSHETTSKYAALALSYSSTHTFEQPFHEYFPQMLSQFDLAQRSFFDPWREVWEGETMDLERALARHSRLMILAPPGAGKTTALQMYASRQLKKISKPDFLESIFNKRRSQCIPVYVPLNVYRPLKGENWIVDTLRTMFPESPNPRESDSFIGNGLKEGWFVLLLDGLNEVALHDLLDVIQDIRELKFKYPSLSLIVTSRMQGQYVNLSLPRFLLHPLDKSFVLDNFLHKDELLEGSSNMYKDLYFRLDYKVRRLLGNPMLLGMVHSILKRAPRVLPTNRGEIFRYFVSQWIEREMNKLMPAAEQIPRVVRFESLGEIGFTMQMRGVSTLPEEQVFVRLAKAIRQMEGNQILPSKTIAAEPVTRELTNNGFFINDNGRIRFLHPSFQEYFAGWSLLTQPQETMFQLLKEVHWEEALSFYVGLLPKADNVVRFLLKQGQVLRAGWSLLYGRCEDSGLRRKIYVQLLTKLYDKYEYNIEQAQSIFEAVDDHILDELLNQKAAVEKNKEVKELFQQILHEREKLRKSVAEKMYKATAGTSLKIKEGTGSLYFGSGYDSIEELQAPLLNQKRIEELLQSCIDRTDENGHFKLRLTEVLRNPDISITNRGYAWWCLSELTGEKPDRVLHTLGTEELLISLWNSVPESFKRGKEFFGETWLTLLWRSSLSLEFRERFVLEHVVIEPEPVSAKRFIDSYYSLIDESPQEKIIRQRLFILGLLRINIQTARDEFIRLWKNTGGNESSLKNLIMPLPWIPIDYDLHLFLLHAIKRVTASETKIGIIKAIAQSPHHELVMHLIPLITDRGEAPNVKVCAMGVMGNSQEPALIPLLKELSQDIDRTIHNAAYTALQNIRKRLEQCEKYTRYSEVRRIPFYIEQGTDGKKYESVDNIHIISIYKSSREHVEIDGRHIKLGPVSGETLYAIAQSQNKHIPVSINVIQKHLESEGYLVQKEQIKNRIADIRQKIDREMNKQLDAWKLVENVRKFGYRLNAKIRILQ